VLYSAATDWEVRRTRSSSRFTAPRRTGKSVVRGVGGALQRGDGLGSPSYEESEVLYSAATDWEVRRTRSLRCFTARRRTGSPSYEEAEPLYSAATTGSPSYEEAEPLYSAATD
jgi:hypothetical protein